MRRSALLLSGLFVLGCVRPAEERAKADLDVGKATNGDLTVHVSHGLAAVRTLESGHLVLWSSAPGWTLELDARTAMTLRLDVRNAMPDAELASLAQGASVSTLQAEPVTHKSFDLTLPAGT
ncbi:MAG TPA: hypothetical protein VF103_12705, partial [Polyangiaceae bacterium]